MSGRRTASHSAEEGGGHEEEEEEEDFGVRRKAALGVCECVGRAEGASLCLQD